MPGKDAKHLLVAAVVGFAAVALTPSTSLAGRVKPRQPLIYVNVCSPQLAPRAFGLFGCSTSPAPPPLTRAYGLSYRHYGASVALANGMVDACLGSDSQLLEACLEGERFQAERGESYRSYPAEFRFFQVVRCTSREHPRPRLYYGKFSYTFAGRPWETRTNLPPARGGDAAAGPAKCRPVRLPRR